MRERDRLRARRPLGLEGESSIVDFFFFLGARMSSSESEILTQIIISYMTLLHLREQSRAEAACLR